MPSEYHLPVDNWLKFLSTQAGRDKVYRFIQYFGRFLAYHLKGRQDVPGAVLLAQRLSKLSLAVGAGRKCTLTANYSLVATSTANASP